MPYVVRNTFTPEYDIERNWSAWIGGAWDTREAALRSLAEDSPRYSEFLDRYYGQLDENEIIERIIEAEQFDVRHNRAYNKWQHVHHEGLSCYELEAETEAGAWEEARAGEFPWFGFGRSTRGAVRLIGHVRGDLYLFWCDDTTTED